MGTIKTLLIITIIFLITCTAFAGTFADYRLLKISAPDQRAVVKTSQGKLQVIGVGVEIDNMQVSEIAEGRVVLTGKNLETVIVRLENGRQRIETYQRLADQAPILTAPDMATEKTAPTDRSDSKSGYQ